MTKAELNQYRLLDSEAEGIKEQIVRLRSRIESPKGQVITGMPGGGDSTDKISQVLGQMEKLQQRYLCKLSRLVKLQIDIETAIYPLTPTEQALMRYRYLQGLTWEEVAVKMHYSWRQVHNIHSSALHKIA